MTALTLADTGDIDRLLPLVGAFQDERGILQDDDTRRTGVMALLDGSPLGAIYLVGPKRAPIGYVAVSFGWSLDLAGLIGTLDGIYIRPGVRGRGIGSEILTTLPRALSGAGLRALHLETRGDDDRLRALCERLQFKAQDDHTRMTRRF